MSTRLRLLVSISALFALVGLVLWFGVFRNNQQPNAEEQPTQAQPKATAELLVGMWKMTKCDYPPIAPEVEILLVFTEDGRFEAHSTDSRNGLQVRVGTYRLEGNAIHFSAEPTARYEAMSWDKVIEVLTDDKLVLVGEPDPTARPRMELQRTTEKLVAPPPRQRPPSPIG